MPRTPLRGRSWHEGFFPAEDPFAFERAFSVLEMTTYFGFRLVLEPCRLPAPNPAGPSRPETQESAEERR